MKKKYEIPFMVMKELQLVEVITTSNVNLGDFSEDKEDQSDWDF